MSSEQHVSSGDDPNVSLQQEQEELEGDNGATLIDVLEVNKQLVTWTLDETLSKLCLESRNSSY